MKVQGYRVGGRSERILEMKGQKRKVKSRGLPSDLAIPIGSPGEFHHPCCQVVELELKADKTSRPVPFYLTLLFICTLIDLFADDDFFSCKITRRACTCPLAPDIPYGDAVYAVSMSRR